MGSKAIIDQLELNKDVFFATFKHLEKEEYLWREKENSWSLLEVLCHLHDEEIEDFRTRVKHVLETPHEHPPSIVPTAWVKERKYQEQNFEEKLTSFLAERANSIQWLRSLEKPNWKNTYVHPKLGKQTAQLYLENWLAHDYLHIRQINKIKYLFFKSCTKESLTYAGSW